jgi:predicted RNA binding protein YcfA (HicA-like mRNA interferase family)
MNPRELLKLIVASPANVQFDDFVALVCAFGFRLRRTSGSHHIFGRDDVREFVNIQNVGGEAKPYQIRQFLRVVERYNLTLETET